MFLGQISAKEKTLWEKSPLSQKMLMRNEVNCIKIYCNIVNYKVYSKHCFRLKRSRNALLAKKSNSDKSFIKCGHNMLSYLNISVTCRLKSIPFQRYGPQKINALKKAFPIYFPFRFCVKIRWNSLRTFHKEKSL